MKKRIIALFSALCLPLSCLGACGTPNNTEPTPSTHRKRMADCFRIRAFQGKRSGTEGWSGL